MKYSRGNLTSRLNKIAKSLTKPLNSVGWEQRCSELQEIADLALKCKGEGLYTSSELAQLFAHLGPALATQLKDPRSKVCKIVCKTIGFLAEVLQSQFAVFGHGVWRQLLQLLKSAKQVIMVTADRCLALLAQISPCAAFLDELMRVLKQTQQENMKAHCCQYLRVILGSWETRILAPYEHKLLHVLSLLITDSSRKVRSNARLLFSSFWTRWCLSGDALFNSLSSFVQDLIMQEMTSYVPNPEALPYSGTPSSPKTADYKTAPRRTTPKQSQQQRQRWAVQAKSKPNEPRTGWRENQASQREKFRAFREESKKKYANEDTTRNNNNNNNNNTGGNGTGGGEIVIHVSANPQRNGGVQLSVDASQADHSNQQHQQHQQHEVGSLGDDTSYYSIPTDELEDHDLRSELELCRTTINALKSENDDVSKALERQKTMNASTTDKLVGYDQKLADFRVLAQKKQQQKESEIIGDVEEKLAGILAMKTMEHDGEMTVMKKRCEAMVLEKRGLMKQLQSLNSKTKAQDREIRHLNTRFANLETRLREQSEGKDKQIVELKVKLGVFGKQKRALEKTIAHHVQREKKLVLEQRELTKRQLHQSQKELTAKLSPEKKKKRKTTRPRSSSISGAQKHHVSWLPYPVTDSESESGLGATRSDTERLQPMRRKNFLTHQARIEKQKRNVSTLKKNSSALKRKVIQEKVQISQLKRQQQQNAVLRITEKNNITKEKKALVKKIQDLEFDLKQRQKKEELE
jgi:hypothetical protein